MAGLDAPPVGSEYPAHDSQVSEQYRTRAQANRKTTQITCEVRHLVQRADEVLDTGAVYHAALAAHTAARNQLKVDAAPRWEPILRLHLQSCKKDTAIVNGIYEPSSCLNTSEIIPTHLCCPVWDTLGQPDC